ncbi:hypothetical protein INT47_003302 [Mucor saturninus]|uniref:Glucose-methanol-choline oxidoreductase N-terminal domain-containing protein n=1 Tax=Mucor saturninus TaxID=64648 RepID=A0A8H7RG19_9FUNG|nr:hypothetical protein INT47_003302 [Mucor saturninus]
MKISTAVITVVAAFASFTNAHSSKSTTDTYDYVIVGGGVAGLTLASRLSDDKSITVAVLEAGPDASEEFVIYAPGMYGQAVGSELCPMIPTVPQKGMNNRSLSVATGKLLGGGSSINGLVWTRGALKDYDAWEELGNPGWNGADMFKYFKKVEDFHPPTSQQAHYGATYKKNVHGKKGRIDIGYPVYEFSQSANWNASLEHLDFTHRQDLMDGSLHGYSITPNTLDPVSARRSSAYTGYIKPYLSRKNLFVLANHTASRIQFAPKSGNKPLQAVGVEWFTTGNSTHKQTIKARREVILSSGTIGSPKLLEISGIGNKDIVTAFGIESLLDLPGVGTNLQDHVHAVAVSTTNITGYTTNSLFSNETLYAEQKKIYTKSKTGMWTTTPNNLGYPSPQQLFENTTFVSPKTFADRIRKSTDEWAQHYASINASHVDLIKKQYEIVASRYEENYLSPIEINFTPGYAGMGKSDIIHNKYQTINQVLVAPLSRGFVHINSSDIEVPSIIDPQYYSHPMDVEVHVASTKLARQLLAAPGLAAVTIEEVEPGTERSSDEDVKQWLVDNVRSDWHVIGTCAMLPRNLGGVVDPNLLVYGTTNLRVVDASIMPLEVSSHLMQPTYGVAEKAADIIKKTLHKRH